MVVKGDPDTVSPELAIRGTMPTTRGHDLGKSGHCHPHTNKQPIQKNVVFHNSKLHFLICKVFVSDISVFFKISATL